MQLISVLLPLLPLSLTAPDPTTLHTSLISPDLVPSLNIFQFQPMQRVGLFADNTLNEVRRSFKDIQNNVERSMSSLLEVGSAIGQRMLGIITRAPRLIGGPPPPDQARPPHLAPVPEQQQHTHYPNFDDCDCHFGKEEEIPEFQPLKPEAPPETHHHPVRFPQEDTYQPLQDLESYGSPVAPAQSVYIPPEQVKDEVTSPPVEDVYVAPPAEDIYVAPPAEDVYVAPLEEDSYVAPVYISTSPPVIIHEVHEIHEPIKSPHHPKGGHNPHVQDILAHENDIKHEAVIHPGGSKDIDVHKVEVLGAESVVQSASASVPDQAHPEKYSNFDSDLLQDIVEVNLWYKDTKKFKHHKHGHKNKVIPHLQLI
jgi:hypothetical protein